MAKGFLDRLLGRAAAPLPHLAAPLADLAKLAQDRPAFAGPAAVLSEVLPVLFGEPVAEPPPMLTPEHAAGKLAAGIPLLRGEAAAPDAKALQRRWLEVCGAAAKPLTAAVRDGRLDGRELLQHVLSGRVEEVHTRAEALQLDAALTATTLRLALFPLLTYWAAVLAPLRQGVSWQHGCCPTCGSWPLLGEFRGLEQIRYLRCGLCASEWEFARLLCPFCGNRDHRSLGYFHVEGEEGSRRAATCDECRGYVKMLATLTPLTAPGLLVADVATLYLDLAAAERGYYVG